MQSKYKFENSANDCSHRYLLPEIQKVLSSLVSSKANFKVLDFGCGNGSMTRDLAKKFPHIHFEGVDPSPNAQRFHKDNVVQNLKFLSWNEFDKAERLDFDIILSVEVIEHVYLPRDYVITAIKHLNPNGTIVVTTPYHGYWKNLAISLTGGWDKHFTALWDYGHIKFWSSQTLDCLFGEFDFKNKKTNHVGRIYPLSKSMIKLYTK